MYIKKSKNKKKITKKCQTHVELIFGATYRDFKSIFLTNIKFSEQMALILVNKR